MAWTNIFALGDWQVYVQYVGVTTDPTPNSALYLVKAEDLDPAVGTVFVDGDGLIVCDFEPVNSAGGLAPTIVVMPSAPVAGAARLTCSDVSALSGVTSSSFKQCDSVEDNGDGTYDGTPSNTNTHAYSLPSEWISAAELPLPVASAAGLQFQRIGNPS